MCLEETKSVDQDDCVRTFLLCKLFQNTVQGNKHLDLLPPPPLRAQNRSVF